MTSSNYAICIRCGDLVPADEDHHVSSDFYICDDCAKNENALASVDALPGHDIGKTLKGAPNVS